MKVIEKIENLSANEARKELFILSGNKEPEVKDKKKRISATKTRFTITLSDETSELLEEAKGLTNSKLSMDELIKKIAKVAIGVFKKDKFKLNDSKRSQPLANVNRVISASIKREVFKRDQKCTNCGSTRSLQFDHRTPHSLGGDSSAKNIRLLCFSCNQRARIRARL